MLGGEKKKRKKNKRDLGTSLRVISVVAYNGALSLANQSMVSKSSLIPNV